MQIVIVVKGKNNMVVLSVNGQPGGNIKAKELELTHLGSMVPPVSTRSDEKLRNSRYYDLK